MGEDNQVRIRRDHWLKFKTGTISLCMIMKNEEKRLERCLKSVRGLVNEIIIVDTGSSDKSIDIAKSYGANIIHQAWQDDFSLARNTSIRAASCDWILILDPDEVISPKDHEAFREYTRHDKFMAYRLHTRNYSGDPKQQGFRPNPNDYEEGKGWPGFIISTKARMFMNGQGIHFRGVWHELLDWYLAIHNIPTCVVDTPIHHFAGEITQGSHREKALFYNRLGIKKVKEWPQNPQAWHELFVSYMILQDYRSAAYCAARSLRNTPPHAGRFFSQARALNELGAKALGNFAFEKGICALYTNLTHIDEEKWSKKDLIV